MSSKIISSNDSPQGIVDVIDGAVGYTALINGFSSIEYGALNVLNNLFLSFMEDIGVKSVSYAEAAGRTKILLSDVVLSLIDFGMDLHNLCEIPKKFQYRGFKDPVAIEEPKQQTQPIVKSKGILHSAVLGPGGVTIIPKPLSLKPDGSSIGTPPIAPVHIRLPPMPQVHTYLCTKIKRPNVGSDPINLRRKLLDQCRKVQLSLTKFLARVMPVKQLFPSDSESLPLLLPKVSKRPYIAALLADSEIIEEGRQDEVKNDSPNSKRARFFSSSTEQQDVTSCNIVQNFYLEKTKFPSA